ncbi:MAG TPA: valine--tRNA ligase [Gammaproteobacteria bacterium]
MDKAYDPRGIETRRYEEWEKRGWFAPRGAGTSYCIMLPPPNVTGSLHMGHAFQQTLMDVLIRHRRMRGENVLWQCGTDHAGIATQIVVERQLEQQGKSRRQLGRDRFLETVWQWKKTSGDTITRQSRRLGTSMDWSRERFTMDPGLSAAVQETFVRLYEAGLIYRGQRLVNWDPVLHTAISDLEVEAEEEDGHLWHIRYPIEDGRDFLIVATTRPETMLGDTAVAVHPDDARYRAWIGRHVTLPLTGRRIPIVGDESVDPEFGTGCVKVTPGHDFNDWAIGQRHGLAVINVFTADAALNDNAPSAYRGLDRFEARKRVVADLEKAGLIEKIQPHRLMVPRGDRSGAVIEPWLTDQWYVKIAPLAEPAIRAVEDGRIRFVPENWSKTYFEWMRNIQDWCISRQLWWGHRIPAWYDREGKVYVGRTEAEVRRKHSLADSFPLRQDEDVLDTWFSSALWPFSTLGWPSTTPELRTFYPTSVLVTGFDIIFFWVARMIMMGLRFMEDVPFREVYIHGLVRDADGQKMSKSKGNILDPLDLIDGIGPDALVKKRTAGLMRPQDAARIEKATRREFPKGIDAYGTDALRFTFASLASPGRNINFDVGRIGGHRNFCNKLWNAARYVLLNAGEGRFDGGVADVKLGLAERWIWSRLHQAIREVSEALEVYRFDLAAQAIHRFTWDEYCDWYLELSKPTLSGAVDEALKHGARFTLVRVLEALLRLAHPIMPFITEEIWSRIAPLCGRTGETIMLEPFPAAADAPVDLQAAKEMEWIMKFVLAARERRTKLNIPPGKPIEILYRESAVAADRWERALLDRALPLIRGLVRAEAITAVTEDVPEASASFAGGMTIYVSPAGGIDVVAERDRLGRELEGREQELARVTAKLANASFVERAPAEVVNKERRRQADLQDMIGKLRQQLENLEKPR